MNGTHVRSKLKIRNRILAIAVAFLLLSLMIPNMSFAEEVNNEATDPVADTPTNAITVTGNVTAGGSGLRGAQVTPFKGSVKLCSTVTTGDGGSFSLDLDDTLVSEGDPIMIMARPGQATATTVYAFEVLATTADANPKTIDLKQGVVTSLQGYEGHSLFQLSTDVASQHSEQTVPTGTAFTYNFPIGGTFKMDEKAGLHFHYVNNAEQSVDVSVVGKGSGLYRPYYWGFKAGIAESQLMKIGQNYTLENLGPEGQYRVALAYQNQTKLSVSSEDANHDAFHFVFSKNGVKMHELTQASFDTTMYVGATCTVQEDGTIKIFKDDSDVANPFVIEATITPIAKAGYKIAGWTYNGEELKVGEPVTATDNVDMAFKAKYEVDASTAPQTGDMTYIFVLALIALVAVSSVGALRFGKNR